MSFPFVIGEIIGEETFFGFGIQPRTSTAVREFIVMSPPRANPSMKMETVGCHATKVPTFQFWSRLSEVAPRKALRRLESQTTTLGITGEYP